ncbi:MAG TPA: zinc ribbon domain-containing protein [Anaerolineales bacterium]|nr:zinc ribbon domain-containing protein [Anaerolineales bacterium]
MELAAILFLLAILLAVTMYLVSPLISNRPRRAAQETQEVSSLLAEQERLLNALQELDFDYQLGKIPEEDYPAQRADLRQKTIDVMKQLDAAAPSRSAAVAPPDPASSENPAQLSDDEIESMLASRRKARKTRSAGFCPRCGKPVLISDQFCPHCGKALQSERQSA